jgi:hypothetical protein
LKALERRSRMIAEGVEAAKAQRVRQQNVLLGVVP